MTEMTQIEQAIAQIAELKAQLPKGACAAQIAMESLCKDEAYNEAIGILKTLLNEQNHANSAKTCKVEQKPTLPGFEEQEGVAGRDYIPVEWVEAIENYGKWKIVRVNEQNPAWSKEDEENLNWFEKFFRAESVVAEGKDIPQDRYLWFKNLKDRVQPHPAWKPTEEQMKAIKHAAKQNMASEIGNILDNLLVEIKTL